MSWTTPKVDWAAVDAPTYVNLNAIESNIAYFMNGDTKAAGKLYFGTSDPSNTNRLNYDGTLHVNGLTSAGSAASSFAGNVSISGTLAISGLTTAANITVTTSAGSVALWTLASGAWAGVSGGRSGLIGQSDIPMVISNNYAQPIVFGVGDSEFGRMQRPDANTSLFSVIGAGGTIYLGSMSAGTWAGISSIRTGVINAGNSPMVISNNYAQAIVFGIGDVEKFRIDSDGSVIAGAGISATGPISCSSLIVSSVANAGTVAAENYLFAVRAASAPAVVEGTIYYNTTTKHFYGADGTSWLQLD